jgi:hypothetical protein
LYRVSEDEEGALALEGIAKAYRNLAEGWTEAVDDDSGNVFYFHPESEETSWERPVPEEPEGEPTLLRQLLKSDDVYILDAETTMFVWIGKSSSPAERREAMKHAQDFIAAYERPAWTQVERIPQGAETPLFKSLFYQWDPPATFDFTKTSGGNVARPAEQKAIDFAAMHAGNPESEAMVDDGSGDMYVYRIVDMEKVPVDAGEVGNFLAGDSYIVHYEYDGDGGRSHMLYFWQGRNSSTIEKGASAARVVEMANELGNNVTQVRVVQGKEPPHFSALFGGAMIVHSGGAGGVVEGEEEARLFHVKGTTAQNTKAVQVPCEAASLNSRDCFVLKTLERCVIWYGGGSNEEEQGAAAQIAARLHDPEDLGALAEGGEDEEWWAALGGEGPYPSDCPNAPAPAEARLFQVSDVTGAVVVTEVPQFTQEDLLDEDVMVLDTFNQVFVWVGRKSTDREKSEAMNIAQAYIDAATDGRDEDTPVIRVEAGGEPHMFTCNFQGWSREAAASFVDPYEAKLAAMKGAAPAEEEADDPDDDIVTASEVEAAEAAEAARKEALAAAAGSGETYSLEELQNAKELGLEVDFPNRWKYLPDDVFADLFGMDKAAFGALPGWKQSQAKKKHGLF